MNTQHQWLQGAIVYQIYPRSFYDNGDSGVGNLQGIIAKLDYLGGTPDSLGVTAIWISPIYTSPMADFGYDISDYCGIDPMFGTIDDFKLLIQEAHRRSIKIIMDFVPNHSSDEHPWFVESQKSIDNSKRDWYVWRDARADGGPPNNWLSVFGGSAWQWSEQTKQYYLHSFLAKQPDLNWDNPAVRQAMKSAMRFWLDLGVDGFRVDAVDWLSKDPDLRDDPVNSYANNKIVGYDYDSLRHRYSRDGPDLFARLTEMTEVLDEYPSAFMVTEAHPETDDTIAGYVQYYQGVNPRLSAPFNFQGIYLPWDAAAFRDFVDAFQAVMKPDYTSVYAIGNHDEPRIATRIGMAAARTAACMQLTLPGMAFIYYGEEIGMTDVSIAEDQIRDPFASPGKGRDPQRTPMQWSTARNAGFSVGEPWLPVASNFMESNVETEAKAPESLLNLYKQLIRYRHDSLVLRRGSYRPVKTPASVFGYKRTHGTDELLVLLNFSSIAQRYALAELRGVVELSTHPDKTGQAINEYVELSPNEGVVILLCTK